MPRRGAHITNDIARKERLQPAVLKLDDEGEHLRGETVVFRCEVYADNMGDGLGPIGFLIRFGRNIAHRTCLGRIDCLSHLARSLRNRHRGYGDGGGMASNCVENWYLIDSRFTVLFKLK